MSPDYDKKYCNADNMNLRWGHFRVLIVSSLGQILGAIITTLIGVILPLIKMAEMGELKTFMLSAIGVSELIGIIVGSVFVGKLTKRFGYLFFFRLSPLIILICSASLIFSHNLIFLIIMLFIIGICIGSEYAIDAAYVSEIMPEKWKFIMVGIIKGTASLGYILTALVCFWVLKEFNNPQYWNYLILIISSMALIMVLTRIKFVESPKWLIANGKSALAEKDLKYLLGNDVVIGEMWKEKTASNIASNKNDTFLCKKNIPKIILSGIPWACEGVGVYGIGTFTPILIMALKIGTERKSEFDNILFSIEMTAFISIFILLGFVTGIILQRKINNIKLQIIGFIGSVIALIILFISYRFQLSAGLSLLGFMAFQFALNIGPHLITFILPSMIYDVENRSMGEGVAAAIGKIGALSGVFCIPYLLKFGGGSGVLIFVIVSFLIGALVTWIFGKIVFNKKVMQ